MAISVVMSVGCSVFGIRSEETPKYEVLATDGNKEIRAYAPYLVAKTTVKNSGNGYDSKATGEAFRILAGYIFGGNQKKQKISMTAPVEMKNVSSNSDSSEKISMTAPVTQSISGEQMQMTFSMPSQYKLEDLPTPDDNRISFEQIPAKTVAVIRFSGWRSDDKAKQKADELRTWIEKANRYQLITGPVFAGYDPPWTIPWFRRNEIMFEVKATP